ncbi:GFA family protein [Hephaestia sp. GCM10023244]|uniref:GFA family protein n=1 Tax=unclassified Hephaestia TaxID=2631281 RepID=UPI0020778F9F|nr:GFA family protein [Hephaestia sp. MAHUQ-44]MCM8730326.1 GFA family protein [Hephaestia sp. MAHUQ-44]
MAETMTGGCQCGRVRYAVAVYDNAAYLCHCRMCQRATGGVSIAFKNVNRADVTWHHAPDWYASSPFAKRAFCRACGTPIGFAFDEGSETMDLTIGSFDDPARFVPAHHFGAESIHEAWLDTRDLPRYRTDEHKPLVDRWMNTLGKLPD